jgi:hypothetical protein
LFYQSIFPPLTTLEEVQDDIAGEQESLPNLVHSDGKDDNNEDINEATNMMAHLEATNQNASKGVTKSTDSEYRRFVILPCLVAAFSTYAHES